MKVFSAKTKPKEDGCNVIFFFYRDAISDWINEFFVPFKQEDPFPYADMTADFLDPSSGKIKRGKIFYDLLLNVEQERKNTSVYYRTGKEINGKRMYFHVEDQQEPILLASKVYGYDLVFQEEHQITFAFKSEKGSPPDAADLDYFHIGVFISLRNEEVEGGKNLIAPRRGEFQFLFNDDHKLSGIQYLAVTGAESADQYLHHAELGAAPRATIIDSSGSQILESGKLIIHSDYLWDVFLNDFLLKLYSCLGVDEEWKFNDYRVDKYTVTPPISEAKIKLDWDEEAFFRFNFDRKPSNYGTELPENAVIFLSFNYEVARTDYRVFNKNITDFFLQVNSDGQLLIDYRFDYDFWLDHFRNERDKLKNIFDKLVKEFNESTINANPPVLFKKYGLPDRRDFFYKNLRVENGNFVLSLAPKD